MKEQILRLSNIFENNKFQFAKGVGIFQQAKVQCISHKVYPFPMPVMVMELFIPVIIFVVKKDKIIAAGNGLRLIGNPFPFQRKELLYETEKFRDNQSFF